MKVPSISWNFDSVTGANDYLIAADIEEEFAINQDADLSEAMSVFTNRFSQSVFLNLEIKPFLG
jgi:hypothetical protein